MKRAPKYSQPRQSNRVQHVRPQTSEKPSQHKRPTQHIKYANNIEPAKNVRQRKSKRRLKPAIKRTLIAIACFVVAIVIAASLVLLIPSWKSATFKWILNSSLGPAIANMIIGDNYEKNVRDKEFDPSKIIVNEGVSTPEGYITLALLGVDAREEDLTKGTFSDSIIVVNIDKEGTIQMSSVYRDTYLLSRTSEGNEVISKANSAYYRNGPTGAINMLNENFDLAITDYVVVNFWGLENIINILGGLRLKITDVEKEHLNYFMLEQCNVGGTEYIPLEESGDAVMLTGAQATAFCRLRDCSFESPLDGNTYTDDYARTARQRYALTELILQSKEKGMLNLLFIANDLFEANNGEKRFVQTSLSISNLCKILGRAYEMKLGDNRAFPDLQYQYTRILDVGDCIVADTLPENVTMMHDFMYKTNGYEPSADLYFVSDKISQDINSQ